MAEERESVAASPLTILLMHFWVRTKKECWNFIQAGRFPLAAQVCGKRESSNALMGWMNGWDVSISIHCPRYVPIAWIRARRDALEQDSRAEPFCIPPAPLHMLFLHDTGYETENVGSASGSNFRVNCFFTRHWNHNFSSIKLAVNVLGDSELYLCIITSGPSPPKPVL